MNKTDILTKKEAETLISGKLSRFFGVSPKEADADQLYKAVVMGVRDILLEKRNDYHAKVKKEQGKRVYYLCMEFLLGRSLKNNVYNLGIGEALDGALKTYGTSLEKLYELEPDAGLGNGGLGRLAACFLDALAGGDYPAMGYCIRYEYGLFKQKIVDGWQMELPDIWLPGGEVWLTQRADKTFTVKFDGHVSEKWTDQGLKIEYTDYQEVEAVPYDMMVSGYDSEAVSVLRLWRAQNTTKFDMRSFSQGDYMLSMKADNEAELISKVLYPSDNHFEGKSLRLKQQYFLVSASLQNIFSEILHRYGTLDVLPEKAAIHINDTHPALAVPEMMRLLMDEHGYSWDAAWDMTVKTLAYTNHTVMAEALETWNDDLISRRLPRVHNIIVEINRRFCEEMWHKYPGDWDKIDRMSVCSHGLVRMANLCVVGTHSVNGVSALHSEIIKKSVFKDFYDVYPDKFTNVTNGIAHRRWLCQANPELCALLNDCIGDGYIKDASQLKEFESFADDTAVLDRLNQIKAVKKRQFAQFAKERHGLIINPDTMFDVQAKRMHEYKRQLLNALDIIGIYGDLLDNPNMQMQPKTFIFGAKAAPGYYMAKQIIKLICYLAADIDKHPAIAEKLKVVYLENYCVTTAEKLMPATELSEQISLAGKEASGTGNMKFMVNGALTIGTLDGANVEMSEAVGPDNIFIFGMTSEDVDRLWKQGYNSSYYYNSNARLQKIVQMLNRGFNGESFDMFSRYLLTDGPVADPYMCLADYPSYRAAQQTVESVYADKREWAKRALVNIAEAGRFSADRSIKEYAQNIWNLKSVR